MCQTFIRLLRKDGRIVNVSSTASGLGQYRDDLQHRFRSPKMTLRDLEELVQEYQVSENVCAISQLKLNSCPQTCADQGTEQQHGWPRMAYTVSKAAQNALTAVLARENSAIAINACCPGWVATDMGRMVGQAPKTPGKSPHRTIRFPADIY